MSDWFTSSCRSRATRRRSSSCARSTSLLDRRRSSSTRSSKVRKDWASLSISSTGSPASWKVEGSDGSIISIRSIRCSRGANRRWSIHRFTQKESTITRARTRNCQRSSEEWSTAETMAAVTTVRVTRPRWRPRPGRSENRDVVSFGVSHGERIPCWCGKDGLHTPYRQKGLSAHTVDRGTGLRSPQASAEGFWTVGLGCKKDRQRTGRPRGRPGSFRDAPPLLRGAAIVYEVWLPEQSSSAASRSRSPKLTPARSTICSLTATARSWSTCASSRSSSSPTSRAPSTCPAGTSSHASRARRATSPRA